MAEVLNQEQVLVNEDTLKIWADYMRYKLGEVWEPTAEGFTKYTPQELLNKLVELPFAKDAIPNSAKYLTGNCQYRFANGGWDWFIKQLGEEITTENINNCNHMFSDCKSERIPFIINLVVGGSGADLSYMFYNSSIKEPVKIKGTPYELSQMFNYCSLLRELPENYFDDFDWSSISGSTNAYQCPMNGMFSGCYSLRYVPIHKIKSNPVIYTSYSYLYNGFSNCYCLDEIKDLPLPFTGAWTTNAFNSGPYGGCFLYVSRLKSLTFALNEGQPCVMNWSGQTIDLSQKVGYAVLREDFLNYNSGITADKEVKDDATYQALKNDPDWFTCNVAYSRYNHDSAVETINSLPDTSAYLAANGGTNTIKFKGAAGSATDGGAINTLTEAEIAVAAAKGWTVSLV